MSLSGDKAARKRLGRLLVQARVDLDVRYKNRAMFARERGLNYRLVQDIEETPPATTSMSRPSWRSSVPTTGRTAALTPS